MDSIDECVWHNIMHDETATTRQGAIEGNNESLMGCYHCVGKKDDCANYRSHYQLKIKYGVSDEKT